MRLGKDRNSLFVEFVTAAARAFFVSGWANAVENYGGSFPPCTELMDVAPATPDVVMLHAARFVGMLESKNHCDLAVMWERAQLGDDHRRTPTLEDFGHYLAMEAMGHGVAWTDDHPQVMLPNRLFGEADVPLYVPYYESDVMLEFDLAYTLPTVKIRRNFKKGLSE